MIGAIGAPFSITIGARIVSIVFRIMKMPTADLLW